MFPWQDAKRAAWSIDSIFQSLDGLRPRRSSGCCAGCRAPGGAGRPGSPPRGGGPACTSAIDVLPSRGLLCNPSGPHARRRGRAVSTAPDVAATADPRAHRARRAGPHRRERPRRADDAAAGERARRRGDVALQARGRQGRHPRRRPGDPDRGLRGRPARGPGRGLARRPRASSRAPTARSARPTPRRSACWRRARAGPTWPGARIAEEAISRLHAAGLDRETAIFAQRTIVRFVLGASLIDQAGDDAPAPVAADELAALAAERPLVGELMRSMGAPPPTRRSSSSASSCC